MTTAQPTPALIWKFSNRAADALEYGDQFLKQLASGQISQRDLNDLALYKGFGADDILFAMGRGAGVTRDPARNNLHARLLELLHQLFITIACSEQYQSQRPVDGGPAPDSWLQTFTAEELAAIAAEFRLKISAFEPETLAAEAEAAVSWIENPTPDSGARKPAKPRKPANRSTAEVRALAALKKDTSVALLPDPIAELMKLTDSSRRSLSKEFKCLSAHVVPGVRLPCKQGGLSWLALNLPVTSVVKSAGHPQFQNSVRR